ncbi:MAG: ATP-dependent zinc metalloprotease FtsH [Planctomycetaceae bacterium]
MRSSDFVTAANDPQASGPMARGAADQPLPVQAQSAAGGGGGEGNSPRVARRGAEQARSMPPGQWMFLMATVVVLTLAWWLFSTHGAAHAVLYSFFKSQLKANNVEAVVFVGEDRITGEWRDPPADPKDPSKKYSKRFTTTPPPKPNEDKELISLLDEHKVTFAAETSAWGDGVNLVVSILMLVLMVAFMWFILRRSADPLGPGGMVGNFIRSPAKRFSPSDQHNTFDDVAGMEQAKKELQEVVEFLKNPAKFQRLGAQIPKGVLLMGPPGTGKTLLARATAGEAGVPFFSINGSEFIQMFVGVGASRVRDMFRTAKENSPCILFIDEIDAVGRVRGAGVGGGHDEREQTLNQILSEMDGFTQTEAVIVLAATNRPDVLDPALLRPGRFDRHVTIDRPMREGRLGILKVHTRKVPLADDVDLDAVAAGTIGFSGADLKNLVNEAALLAAREGKTQVDASDFDEAKDKVLMGPQREEVLNTHEREMTAYHEAGHALVAWLLPDLDPVHKVTIVPRGRALGVTQLLPDEERHHMGEQRLHSRLVLWMAGRAAEKMVFDEYSAGAESDIKQATDLARRMVAHWGMSEIVGPVAFRQSEEHPFLGKEMHEMRQFSEETAHVIDQEVQRFLNDASTKATEILERNRKDLDRLAQELLKREILTKEEMTELLGARSGSTTERKAS